MTKKYAKGVEIKIAIVVPGFSVDEQDWCIPALLDFVRVLAAQAEVHVFTLRWPERNDTYSVYGAVVHALGGRKNIGLRGALQLYTRAVQKITAEHNQAPFSAIHAFWADEPGWVAAWVGRLLNIPVVISLAGGELIGMRDINYGVQLLPGRDALIRMSLASAKWITAGSKYLLNIARNHLDESAKEKLVLAPLGVDTELFSPSVQKNENRKILNVGSLYPIKDQGRMIRATSSIPDVHLEIAGGGPLMSDLYNTAFTFRAADRVKLLGEIDHDKMPELYRSASILVQSSRHESQGMAVLEAAACGIICVGTPVGVLPETGIQVNDDSEMIYQINRLLNDRQYRLKLGESAREEVVKMFSLKPSVEKFISLYNA